jgi:hypothetical protein
VAGQDVAGEVEGVLVLKHDEGVVVALPGMDLEAFGGVERGTLEAELAGYPLVEPSTDVGHTGRFRRPQTYRVEVILRCILLLLSL